MSEGAWEPWASVSFTGARHRIALEMAATDAAYAWLAALPELDLPLRGHLVADLHVASRDVERGRLHVLLEALTVEEC
ncbi:hypothetical protein [Sphingomonas azotifigens]|uniref:hypothetical protein n=1 Tax=Sphingomonas azotifigens TaxID=330920 RepID=UPI00111C781E|nr:hypothetical protein [Sphingomonas azotifigens]